MIIDRVKLIYGANISDEYTDEQLEEYIGLAKEEVIRWEYSLVGIPEELPDLTQYESVIVMSVVVGLTQSGAEGESVHVEGSFNRHFSNDTMIDYIHKHVVPYAGVGR